MFKKLLRVPQLMKLDEIAKVIEQWMKFILKKHLLEKFQFPQVHQFISLFLKPTSQS